MPGVTVAPGDIVGKFVVVGPGVTTGIPAEPLPPVPALGIPVDGHCGRVP